MKARVKAKQVEVMTNVSQQLIRVNVDYYRQIQELKKQIESLKQDIRNHADSKTHIFETITEQREQNQRLVNETVRHAKFMTTLIDKMPKENEKGELLYEGNLYKRKTSFAEWLFGKHS